jgi:membrane protease YdiL (CAAX protease family)
MAISKELKKNNIKIIIKIVLTIFIVNVLLSKLYNNTLTFFNFEFVPNPIPFSNIYEEFFLVVFFAPIIETIFFQFLPAYFLKRFNKLIIIFVSSIMFGLLHWYNIMNFIYGLFVGLLFILGYLYSLKRKSNPITTIILAHSFYNLYAFIINNFYR